MADEEISFEEWEREIRNMLPWPDALEVFGAIDTAGFDRPVERIKLLKELVEGHYSAMRSGVFNDE